VNTTATTERQTFDAWLVNVYAQRFTGPVTIHFAQGVPNVVEIPCQPTKIVLDRRKVRRDT
jgi:hypothetical protein